MDAFAHGEERNWTSNVYHLGTDLQSAATPPIVAASPECADTSLHISVRNRATHTVSDQLGTIGTEGFEPSIRLSLLFSVYTPLLPIKIRSETATRRLAIMFFVPCVALSGLQPFTGNSLIAKNQPTKLAIVHRTVSFHISVRYHLGWARTWTAHLKPFDYQFHEASYSGKYLSCHHPTNCYTFGGVQLGHHGIDARIINNRFSRR